MGNHSRDTFDPFKRYSAVRLQQGVPLVDADWNEQNDVLRQELYDSMISIWGNLDDGIFPSVIGGISFQVNPAGANNIQINGGSAVVNGRVVTVPLMEYDSQPWLDPDAADKAAIDPIPPMTTPTTDRTDLVYLDVWDREVASAEDPDIVNPVIGIETSVRFKREYCYRVAEGQSYPPAAPPRHRFMRVALLHRTKNNDTVALEEIEDLRRFIYGIPGTHYQTIAPALLSYASSDGFDNYMWFAVKPSALTTVSGFTPLVLPHRCRFLSLTAFGSTGSSGSAAQVTISVYRSLQDGSWPFPVVSQTMTGDPFSRMLTIPSDEQIINNRENQYFIFASATGAGDDAYLYGFRAFYQI